MTEEQKQELNAVTSLRLHWPEYVMELTEMVVHLAFTCIFATRRFVICFRVALFVARASASR
jgi:hypothetical protein